MKRLLGVALGILTAIGGFVDIGDLVTNAQVGARFGMSLGWVVSSRRCRDASPPSATARRSTPRSAGGAVGTAHARAAVVHGGRHVGSRDSGPGSRRVLDVRLTAAPGGRGAQVAALIVGYGRPGSWLGYERSRERGPRAVAAVVRWLHRHSRLVALGPDVELDWSARRVRVGPDADVRPLDA